MHDDDYAIQGFEEAQKALRMLGVDEAFRQLQHVMHTAQTLLRSEDHKREIEILQQQIEQLKEDFVEMFDELSRVYAQEEMDQAPEDQREEPENEQQRRSAEERQGDRSARQSAEEPERGETQRQKPGSDEPFQGSPDQQNMDIGGPAGSGDAAIDGMDVNDIADEIMRIAKDFEKDAPAQEFKMAKLDIPTISRSPEAFDKHLADAVKAAESANEAAKEVAQEVGEAVKETMEQALELVL